MIDQGCANGDPYGLLGEDAYGSQPEVLALDHQGRPACAALPAVCDKRLSLFAA